MREILFRGKEKDQWVGGYYWKYEQNGKEFHVIRDSADKLLKFNHICDPKTLGQYTGLTDKNGTKIFEGDILRSRITGEKFIVIWDMLYSAFAIRNSKVRYGFPKCDVKTYQVVGNIHDNPELIKDGEI